MKAYCRPNLSVPTPSPTKNVKVPLQWEEDVYPQTTDQTLSQQPAFTESHYKLLSQFVVSVVAYPYPKNQHHNLIHSWHIVVPRF